MSLRRRSQEDDKEEDFVNKAPFSLSNVNIISLSLSILPARCEEYRTTFGWGEAILLTIKKVLLLLLLNPIRALSKGVLLSRAAIRRKSLQESIDTKLLFFFFWMNVLCLVKISSWSTLSLSLSFVSLSKKTFCASLCGPFVLLLFRCFLVLPPFRVRRRHFYHHKREKA